MSWIPTTNNATSDNLQAVADSVPTKQQELEMLKSLPFDELMDTVVQQMVKFTINLAIAIIVFVIGRFIIRKINALLHTIMIRRKVDRSLATFIESLVRILLYFMLIVITIGILGIETSSFIALFASAGVAIGMALSGTLQNFAGGVLILLLKPYKVGDYIEAQGYAGTVKEIQIFSTIITTPDNKSIIIPNGGLSTASVNNYSREAYRRVEWLVSISYGDSVEAARTAILAMLAGDPRVVKQYVEDHQRYLAAQQQEEECEVEEAKEKEDEKRSWLYRLFHKHHKCVKDKIDDWQTNEKQKTESKIEKANRAPALYVKELGDSSVNLTVRAWVRNSDYWSVFYEINERIYKELPDYGIHFPFPQMDVHLKEEKDS